MNLLKRIDKIKSHILSQSPINYSILLIFIFAFLTLVGILNHAMWRDEINGWLIARDSVSLSHFLQNIKYEGHPVIWYFCLWILNQFTANPIAMQIFHWIVTLTTFSLFILFSPFNKFQKTLFIFGYLPIYEYSLISRNYSIGILTIFLFCIFFRTRHKTYIPLALILSLMANTNAYCLLISIALAVTLGLEYIFRIHFQYKTSANINNLIGAVGLFGIGIMLSIFMLMPPIDSTLQGGANQWIFEFDFYRLTQTISRIWRSYVLVIIPSDSKPLDLFIFSVFSLGLWGFITTLLIKKPLALFFYLIATLEFLMFTYVKFLGSQRHYGHLYIILITALWLEKVYPDSNLILTWIKQLPRKFTKVWATWLNFVENHKQTVIAMILWLQVIAGIIAFSRDLVTPYSTSKATANFIQSNQLDSKILVGSEDFAVSPLSGYLNQKIYYPETQSFGSYVLFTQARKSVTDHDILKQVSDLINRQKTDILLILNHELSESSPDLNISFLARFNQGFIYNEKYYLYLVKYTP